MSSSIRRLKLKPKDPASDNWVTLLPPRAIYSERANLKGISRMLNSNHRYWIYSRSLAQLHLRDSHVPRAVKSIIRSHFNMNSCRLAS
jgi:hypothetical protein